MSPSVATPPRPAAECSTQGSNPTLTNVAVSGNSATDSGGGMFNTSSSPTLTNVTINGNSADNSGGGMFNEVNSNPQTRNSIVWGNGSTAIVNNASAPAFSYSLIEGGVPSGATDGGNNLNTDPLFVTPINPANAPTTAGDLRLRAGSPAIDAGNDDVTNPVLPTTDRDGNPRRLDGNLDGVVRVDMGAYERGIYRVLIPLVNPVGFWQHSGTQYAAAAGGDFIDTANYTTGPASVCGRVHPQ